MRLGLSNSDPAMLLGVASTSATERPPTREKVKRKRLSAADTRLRKEVLTLKDIFEDDDLNGDHKITLDEFLHNVEVRKPTKTERTEAERQHAERRAKHAIELRCAMFKVIDYNRDDILTFYEYLRVNYPKVSNKKLKEMVLWAYPPEEEHVITADEIQQVREEHENVFKMFDEDGNGVLDEYELGNVGFSQEDIEILMEKYDMDGMHGLDLEEFLNMLAKEFDLPVHVPLDRLPMGQTACKS